MDEVLTLLLYLLIMVAVIGVVFAVVWLVFGRSEDLPRSNAEPHSRVCHEPESPVKTCGRYALSR